MQKWAALLEPLGTVVTLDYAYQVERRSRPDPLPKLISTHRAALAQVRQRSGNIILVGKSMGGRIGCHVSLEEKVNGLVCLGYPLCGGGDPSKLRDQVLLDLTTPVLFVQGTRDALCPLELLHTVRQKMTAPHELEIVQGGDHSLTVGKRELKSRGQTQEDIDSRVVEAIRGFVQRPTPDESRG